VLPAPRLGRAPFSLAQDETQHLSLGGCHRQETEIKVRISAAALPWTRRRQPGAQQPACTVLTARAGAGVVVGALKAWCWCVNLSSALKGLILQPLLLPRGLELKGGGFICWMNPSYLFS